MTERPELTRLVRRPQGSHELQVGLGGVCGARLPSAVDRRRAHRMWKSPRNAQRRADAHASARSLDRRERPTGSVMRSMRCSGNGLPKENPIAYAGLLRLVPIASRSSAYPHPVTTWWQRYSGPPLRLSPVAGIGRLLTVELGPGPSQVEPKWHDRDLEIGPDGYGDERGTGEPGIVSQTERVQNAGIRKGGDQRQRCRPAPVDAPPNA